MIEQCAFGSMVINQRTYASDLMIFPDGRVMDNWRRVAGHRLAWADIEELVACEPDVIVAGTGLMRLKRDLVQMLTARGIELVSARTRTAAKEFNRLNQTTKKVAACFHLTC